MQSDKGKAGIPLSQLQLNPLLIQLKIQLKNLG